MFEIHLDKMKQGTLEEDELHGMIKVGRGCTYGETELPGFTGQTVSSKQDASWGQGGGG